MEENNYQPNPTVNVPNPSPIPPVSNSIPTQSQGSTSPKKSKLFLIIIVIIIFLLLAGCAAGFYLFKQNTNTAPKPTPAPSPAEVSTKVGTPDPTANWKTYQGNGFSFKYPPNGTLGAATPTTQIFISDNGTDPHFIFTIKISDNTLNLTPQQVFENEVQAFRDNKNNTAVYAKSLADYRQSTITDYTNGMLNGATMRLGKDGDSVTDGLEVVSINNNKVYEFMIHDGNGSISNSQKQILNQILATFKFNDSNVTPTPDPTATWKTFTPSVSGIPLFEFKYPSEYRVVPAGEEFFGGIKNDVTKAGISLKILFSKFLQEDFQKTYQDEIIVSEGKVASGQTYFIAKNKDSNTANFVWIDTGSGDKVLELDTNLMSTGTLNQILSTFKFTN